MEDGGQTFTEQQISYAASKVDERGYVEEWGLDGPEAREYAIRYYMKVAWSSFFCAAYHLPYHHPQFGVGVLGLYSSGASTRLQAQRAGLAPGIEDPHWVGFDVFHFPGVCLGDLHGMIRTQSEYLGTLGELLDVTYPNWRIAHPQTYDTAYYDSLREILRGMGIHTWVEIFSGRSYLFYEGLDVYWKVRGVGISDRVSTWWVVNASLPPYQRWQLTPDQWDQCLDWVCVGNRSQEYFDHTLVPVAGIQALRGVSFQPTNAAVVEAMALGLLRQYRPGTPFPFPTTVEIQAYGELLRHFQGKGKGKGKGMLKGRL